MQIAPSAYMQSQHLASVISASSSSSLSGSGSGVDPVRASVGHLLSKAYGLPCSAAAQAFTQIVQPTSRFQLALDALLPLLDPNTPAELTQRILVSFILYSLYAPYPIAINPFKSVLFVTFVKEREKAVNIASVGGGVCANEQLVWVLWKILKGDGNDIGPYSPSTLARSPLPPKLRASNLLLDDELYNSNNDNFPTSDFSRADSLSPPLPTRRSPITRGPTSFSFSFSTNIASAPSSQSLTSTRADQDAQNESIAHAMTLLLAARERVLTLSEQRFLTPLLPHLSSPPHMITSFDLAPLISRNPTLAHPLFVALLSAPTPAPTAPTSDFTSASTSPSLSPLYSSAFSPTASSGFSLTSNPNSDTLPIQGPSPFLDVLPTLPPTLPTFDLLGRLLRDPTLIPAPSWEDTDRDVGASMGENANTNLMTEIGNTTTNGGNNNSNLNSQSNWSPKTTIADLIRIQVLGRFIHESINWLEHAEREEREGLISDDRFATGVRNLCRFYNSLIKLSIIDPASDADSAEMAHFSLRNARFEEANALYRVLAGGRGWGSG